MADNSMVTKKDLGKLQSGMNKNMQALEKRLNRNLSEFAENILAGMEGMFREQDRRDDEKFATKEDLKREVGFLHNDIKDLEAELVDVPSRKQVDDNTRRISKLEAAVV